MSNFREMTPQRLQNGCSKKFLEKRAFQEYMDNDNPTPVSDMESKTFLVPLIFGQTFSIVPQLSKCLKFEAVWGVLTDQMI